MKAKIIGLLTIFLVGVLAICGVANAGITIEEVEFDGTELNEHVIPNLLDVVRGEEYDIKVIFTSNESIKDVQVEDEVVILGEQGKVKITAEQIAQKMGSINYEVTTKISPFLPRIVR